jgi:catalase
MTYSVDTVGQNPHVNYEPNSLDGLEEDPGSGPEHQPYVEGRVGRQHISRRNDHAQAGERYRTMPDWEREDLVVNLIDLLGQCDRPIQERMVDHLARCDSDYGRRVAEGLGLSVPEPAGSTA